MISLVGEAADQHPRENPELFETDLSTRFSDLRLVPEHAAHGRDASLAIDARGETVSLERPGNLSGPA